MVLPSIVIAAAMGLAGTGVPASEVRRAPVKPVSALVAGFPPFHFWRRVYLERGVSRFKRYRVDPSGKLAMVWDAGTLAASQIAINDERKLSLGRTIPGGPAGCGSSTRWEVVQPNEAVLGRWNGTAFLLRDRVSGKADPVEVMDDKSMFFGMVPWCWGDGGQFLYLTVTQGMTGSRNIGLLRFRAANRSYLKIGDCVAYAMSPDGLWIAWIKDSLYADLGGKKVYTSHLMIYSMREETSYQITGDIECDSPSFDPTDGYEWRDR
jgi:hypothetical protein